MSNFKRRIYLINPSFQLKSVFIITILIIVSTFIYPLTIYDIFDMIDTHFKSDANIMAQRDQLLFFLFLIQSALLIIVSIFIIFMTHKVVGPLYKLQQAFKAVINGGELRKVYFRNGDNFQELAHTYSEMVETVQNRINQTSNDAQEALDVLKNVKTDLPEIKEAIIKLELIVSDENHNNESAEKQGK